jgi:cobalt-zinc-cadmium efflux system protein
MRHDEDLNVRSAVLHMLGDAAASAGVIIAGVLILFTHWYVVDPILSVLIALLIASGAWRIVHQTVLILMEGTPRGVDFNEVVKTIKSVSCVRDVHDVHIWTIASGRNALSCHIVVDGEMSVHSTQTLLRDIEHRLVHMGIGHVTVQTEDPEHPHEGGELCCQPESLPKAHSH